MDNELDGRAYLALHDLTAASIGPVDGGRVEAMHVACPVAKIVTPLPTNRARAVDGRDGQVPNGNRRELGSRGAHSAANSA